MPPDDAVQAFVESAPTKLKPIVEAARELILDVHPEAKESIKWDQLVYEVDGTNRIYINYFTNHVNVGFMQGSDLDDPQDLLEGTGKSMRHVTVHDVQDLENSALRALIANAAVTE